MLFYVHKTIRLIRDVKPSPATSTFTQLLSPERVILLCSFYIFFTVSQGYTITDNVVDYSFQLSLRPSTVTPINEQNKITLRENLHVLFCPNK